MYYAAPRADIAHHLIYLSVFKMIRLPPRATLFPNTPLSRSPLLPVGPVATVPAEVFREVSSLIRGSPDFVTEPVRVVGRPGSGRAHTVEGGFCHSERQRDQFENLDHAFLW